MISKLTITEQNPLHYLTKTGKASKRFWWKWCDGKSEEDHVYQMCHCDFEFCIRGASIDFYRSKIYRKEGTRIKTGEEMVHEFFAFVNFMYYKIDGQYRLKDYTPTKPQMMFWHILSNIGPNMKIVPSVTGQPNYPSSQVRPTPISEVSTLCIFFDYQRFAIPLDELLEKVLQKNDLVEGPSLVGPPESKYTNLFNKSIYNYNYGHRIVDGNMVPNVIVTTEDVIGKIPRALAKMNREPLVTAEIAQFLSRQMNTILNLLCGSCFLDVEKHFGKYTWTWNASYLNNLDLNNASSAGIWQTPSKSYVNGDTQYNVGSSSATKGEILQTVFEKISEIARDSLLGKNPQIPHGTTKASLKHETYNVHPGMSDAEVWKLFHKIRIFHIGDCLGYVMAFVVDKLRHEIESGNMIKVKMTMEQGGAFEVAKYLNYDDPALSFGTGDVSSLDCSLPSALLSLYHAMGVKYFYKAKFEEGMWRLFTLFRKHVSTSIAQHICQLFGTIWVWINGEMASGKFATSHGDSWCMAFLFVSFLVYQMEQYPQILEEIMQWVLRGKIRAIFYGDDDSGCYPDVLRDVIGRKAFSTYLDKWRITTRDVKEYKNFLTRINKHGEITYEGPVFLKVFFVARDNISMPSDVRVHLPPVLPYRKIEQVVGRIAYGKGEERSHGVTLISCLGLVNGSYGTCEVAYNFLKLVFCSIKRNLPETWFQDTIDLYTATGKVRALNSLLKGFAAFDPLNIVFPTRSELLMRNKHVPQRHFLSDSTPPWFVSRVV